MLFQIDAPALYPLSWHKGLAYLAAPDGDDQGATMSAEHSELLRISLLSRALRSAFDARARSVGITRAQWIVLAAVRREEGATQRRIADAIDVGDVTIGRIVDKVCEGGWLERRTEPADRRGHRLFLTPASRPILESLDRIASEEEERAFDGISAAERTEFGRMLDLIASNVAAEIPAAGQPSE